MIPVCEPLIGKKELEYVTDCIKTGWISSSGKYIEEFEDKWASYCGRKYGIAVSNGTTALQLALGCLGLEPGDEVIMPSFTIISCAMAVIYNGAKPVLVDSDPEIFTIDISKIEEKITKRTKAIMPVHIYGHPCDMDPIMELAEKYGLSIIEDAAEAHGAEYRGRKCGSFGGISCFSFYANKIITTGEGGMVLTDDINYAEKARSLRNLSFQKEKRFLHTELGYNFRMTNIQAALGVAQTENTDRSVERKRWMAEKYNRNLKDISDLILPLEKDWAKNVYWMYAILLRENHPMDAEELSKVLGENGIGTRPFFLGMHEQPVLKKMGLFADETYPVTEMISRKGLYLPSGLTLKEEEIYFISKTLKNVLY